MRGGIGEGDWIVIVGLSSFLGGRGGPSGKSGSGSEALGSLDGNGSMGCFLIQASVM
jgi:hypothetical protein